MHSYCSDVCEDAGKSKLVLGRNRLKEQLHHLEKMLFAAHEMYLNAKLAILILRMSAIEIFGWDKKYLYCA